MDRRRTGVLAVVAVVLLAAIGVFGNVVIGIGTENPGDCGLGTGGVWRMNPDAESRNVTSPTTARAVLNTTFASNTSRHLRLAESRSDYQYRPAAEITEAFRTAVVERAQFDASAEVYYFVPPTVSTPVGSYDGTLVVTRSGAVYVVRVGAC